MKKIIFLMFLSGSLLYSNTISKDGGECITKQELMTILKNIFPKNKNINYISDKKREDMYRNLFDKFPNKAIIKKLDYYHKRGVSEEVIIRCDYLINNRELKQDNRVRLLNTCADYKMKYYEYDTAISYLEELLDKNNGDLNVREIIKKLIYLYERKQDEEKVRYFKNIISD